MESFVENILKSSLESTQNNELAAFEQSEKVMQNDFINRRTQLKIEYIRNLSNECYKACMLRQSNELDLSKNEEACVNECS